MCTTNSNSVTTSENICKMPAFSANIPGLLKTGDRIEIAGKFKDKAKRMSVSLCSDDGEEPQNVVLHFDVRFERDVIVTLSRKDGVWVGSGNYDVNYNMFSPGAIFHIIFVVKDADVISIYCQGKFHSNFLPKIPISFAKYMVAWADVKRVSHCFFYISNNKPPIEKRSRESSKDQVCNVLKDEHRPAVQDGSDDERYADKFIRENLTYNVGESKKKKSKTPWMQQHATRSKTKVGKSGDHGQHQGYDFRRKQPEESSDVSD